MASLAEQRFERLAAERFVPAGRPTGTVAGTAHSVRDIWSYRELLGLLVRRELKARYKDSTLGFLWSLLRPMALLAVYYIAIGKFLGASKSAPDFAIALYAGLTIWQLFAEIVGGCTGAIVANAGLVKKIYLPREVFPLSVVGASLFNFIIQLMVLVGATFLVGAPPWDLDLVIYFPAAVLLVLVFATAFGFLLGAINVYLRDVGYLVEIVLMFMMWTAPVVYPFAYAHKSLGDGAALHLYLSNPLAVAVLSFQKAFWVRGKGQDMPTNLGSYIIVELIVGVVLLWLFQRVFARLQDNFAQEL